MKELKLTVPEGYKAEWVNDVLTLVKKDITERVKIYADALRELNLKESDLWFYNLRVPSHVVAQARLEIIISALNEGWVPDRVRFDELEYYPIFKIIDGVHNNSNNRSDNFAFCGLACSHSSHTWRDSFTSHMSRLALKNRELAKYAGNQFIELYKEVLLIK